MANNNLLFNFCYQRSRQQAFAIAPNRTELQQSPYPTYTTKQLDMRRKAEILKYKPSKQSTQTNNLTKKQVYTLMVNSRFTRTNFPSSQIGNTLVCTNDNLIPTPTSSSGIPGPIQYLIYDESIPLYNYTTKDQPFNMVEAINITSFSVSNFSNHALYYSSLPTYNTISSVYFRGIFNDIKNININIPLGISLQGNIVQSDINANSLPASIDIKNIWFDVNIFYGNVIIDTNHTITMNNKPLSSMNTFDLSFTVNLISGIPFYSNNYIGNMNIQNLSVFVGSGSIYDIEITVGGYTPIIDNLVNLNSIFFVGNYTNTIDTSSNCTISANSISDTYSPININIL
jgi:hypothetical protein